MKYIVYIVTPIIKLIYGIFYFLIGNLFYLILYTFWNIQFPNKTSIIEFNEHYRRCGNNTIYYKTFINYILDFRGYTKIYK